MCCHCLLAVTPEAAGSISFDPANFPRYARSAGVVDVLRHAAVACSHGERARVPLPPSLRSVRWRRRRSQARRRGLQPRRAGTSPVTSLATLGPLASSTFSTRRRGLQPRRAGTSPVTSLATLGPLASSTFSGTLPWLAATASGHESRYLPCYARSAGVVDVLRHAAVACSHGDRARVPLPPLLRSVRWCRRRSQARRRGLQPWRAGTSPVIPSFFVTRGPLA